MSGIPRVELRAVTILQAESAGSARRAGGKRSSENYVPCQPWYPHASLLVKVTIVAPRPMDHALAEHRVGPEQTRGTSRSRAER